MTSTVQNAYEFGIAERYEASGQCPLCLDAFTATSVDSQEHADQALRTIIADPQHQRGIDCALPTEPVA